MKIILGKEQYMFLIKTLLIMKFYLLLAFFGVVQAKTPVYSQKMNLHFKNSKVDLVLRNIENSENQSRSADNGGEQWKLKLQRRNSSAWRT